MRKLFTLASLALILHAVSAPAITWKYGNLNSSTLQCRLTGWSGNEPSSGKLTVPSYYVNPADGKSYTVVSIGDGALDSLKTVTQITIPASINRIGDSGKGKGNADDQFAYNFRGALNWLNLSSLPTINITRPHLTDALWSISKIESTRCWWCRAT